MLAYVVSDHDPVSEQIREVLLFSGHECPTSHIMPLSSAVQRVMNEPPEVVILVLAPDFERGLSILSLVRAATQARIMVVGPTEDAKLVLRALRGGADDIVDSTELASELQAALTRLTTANFDQGMAGKLVTVLGPNGGSGSSTLAANIATALAKEHQSAGLIDLKLETGDLASLLDLQPTYTMSDLCQNLSRLDRVMFERTLVKHDSGVHLLAPPRLISDISHVTEEGVNQALALARVMFPYVVVDLDHGFRPIETQVLSQSDIVLIVFRLDFTSLRNTRRTLEHLERLEVARDRIRLVVNRYGQAKEVPAAKAEEALGVKIHHYIPDDPKTINRANNNGVPVVIEAPSAKVAKSVTLLARSVNGHLAKGG